MRILFLSLEFSAQTFSGNGIAAQSQAKALAATGPHVLVIAASPIITQVTQVTQDVTPTGQPDSAGSFSLIEVPVSSWGRLDSSAPWQEYESGCSHSDVVQAVATFAPDVAMVVDWSAMPAWTILKASLGRVVPYVWLNYRVFSRTETGPGHDLVSRLEAAAMQGAVRTIVLSRSDQQYLMQHVHQPALPSVDKPVVQQGQQPALTSGKEAIVQHGQQQAALPPVDKPVVQHGQQRATSSSRVGSGEPVVLLCALRGDIKGIPMPPDMAGVSLQHGMEGVPMQHGVVGSSTQHGVQGTPMQGQEHQCSSSSNSSATAGAAQQCAAIDLQGPSATTAAAGASQHRNTDPAPRLHTQGQHLQSVTSISSASHITPYGHTRSHLTCVVRLAPEKEPQLFVALVAALQRRGVLQRHGLVPLMVGSSNDEFAQGLKSALREAAPQSLILEEFMGPTQLAKVYAATRLNIHPATYDAFGMTIVEAASQGCPSLVHDGDGAVGATDLLRATEQEVILVDLKQHMDHVAQVVETILADSDRLETVGRRAAARARSWDEAAHARTLVQMTEEALGLAITG